jgi:murein DD-endopeptidase MepM/ murein hydrolase activator NlpD
MHFMLHRHITLIVIPDAKHVFKKFSVSQRLLLGGAAIAIMVLLFSGYSLVENFKLRYKISGLSSVEEENQALRVENARVEIAAQKMRERLVSLEATTTKLSVIAGLRNSFTSRQDLERGVGDIPDAENSDDFVPLGRTQLPNNESATLRGEMEELEQQSNEIEENLKNLESHYADQEDALARTPSIRPVATSIGYSSSSFGWRVDPFTRKKSFHHGIDISALPGTEVIAPADGTVTKVYNDRRGGRILELSHGDGFKTVFGHLQDYNVRRGDKVKRGDVIAYVGNSGRSTGPHLHYEVQVDGKRMNPKWFILD